MPATVEHKRKVSRELQQVSQPTSDSLGLSAYGFLPICLSSALPSIKVRAVETVPPDASPLNEKAERTAPTFPFSPMRALRRCTARKVVRSEGTES